MPELKESARVWHDPQHGVLRRRASNTSSELGDEYTNCYTIPVVDSWAVLPSEVKNRLAGAFPGQEKFYSDRYLVNIPLDPSPVHISMLKAITKGEAEKYKDPRAFNLRAWHFAPHRAQERDFRYLLTDYLTRVIPIDVQVFAFRHGLIQYLTESYLKVAEFFPNPRNLKTEFVTDPESDESWLSVRFVTEGSLDDITAARKKYRRFWVSNVPVSKRLMIRLMYDID